MKRHPHGVNRTLDISTPILALHSLEYLSHRQRLTALLHYSPYQCSCFSVITTFSPLLGCALSYPRSLGLTRWHLSLRPIRHDDGRLHCLKQLNALSESVDHVLC